MLAPAGSSRAPAGSAAQAGAVPAAAAGAAPWAATVGGYDRSMPTGTTHRGQDVRAPEPEAELAAAGHVHLPPPPLPPNQGWPSTPPARAPGPAELQQPATPGGQPEVVVVAHESPGGGGWSAGGGRLVELVDASPAPLDAEVRATLSPSYALRHWWLQARGPAAPSLAEVQFHHHRRARERTALESSRERAEFDWMGDGDDDGWWWWESSMSDWA